MTPGSEERKNKLKASSPRAHMRARTHTHTCPRGSKLGAKMEGRPGTVEDWAGEGWQGNRSSGLAMSVQGFPGVSYLNGLDDLFPFF